MSTFNHIPGTLYYPTIDDRYRQWQEQKAQFCEQVLFLRCFNGSEYPIYTFEEDANITRSLLTRRVGFKSQDIFVDGTKRVRVVRIEDVDHVKYVLAHGCFGVVIVDTVEHKTQELFAKDYYEFARELYKDEQE